MREDKAALLISQIFDMAIDLNRDQRLALARALVTGDKAEALERLIPTFHPAPPRDGVGPGES